MQSHYSKLHSISPTHTHTIQLDSTKCRLLKADWVRRFALLFSLSLSLIPPTLSVLSGRAADSSQQLENPLFMLVFPSLTLLCYAKLQAAGLGISMAVFTWAVSSRLVPETGSGSGGPLDGLVPISLHKLRKSVHLGWDLAQLENVGWLQLTFCFCWWLHAIIEHRRHIIPTLASLTRHYIPTPASLTIFKMLILNIINIKMERGWKI